MINGNDMWDRRIKQFCVAARKRGFKAEVLRQAQAIAPGINWSRMHLSKWLSARREDRAEPSAGNGEILLAACAKASLAIKKGGRA